MAISYADPNDIFKSTVWGPHYWFFLTTLALSYPDNPNSVTKRKYYDFITNLPLFIPNSEIGNRFSNLLDRYPVSPYLDNRDSFIKWVHFIHNKVNVLLGKEEISFDAALENYFAEYSSKPIVLSERMKWKKHTVICVFIFLCALLIYLNYSGRH
jgi:hypothetical protein